LNSQTIYAIHGFEHSAVNRYYIPAGLFAPEQDKDLEG
jgi:hypothetical protein